MDAFIETLSKVIPFAGWLEHFGMSKGCASGFATVIISFLVYLIIKTGNYAFKRYRYCKAAQDLSPWFDYLKVKSYQEFFIPTKFQNNSPTREDEPAFSHKFVSKSLLVPFFMNTAFNEKKESDKYYLVLADSGMGKTTFMINLYLRYSSFFNFGKKYNIRLFPFGDPRILERIKEIDKKEIPNTILLLDAFDEDQQLLPPQQSDGLTDEDRFRKRLDDIFETVRDFREVIITSRTQYFPGQEEQPYELNLRRFDDKGFHKLAKFYLSPFNSKEIKRYLNKKFGVLRWWNSKKKKNAMAIVMSAPKLMVRPMLLSYIDLLVNSTRKYKNTFQIYEELITKWIEREANKRRHKSEERGRFMNDLYVYSQKVALKIYERRKESEMLSLARDEAVSVARDHGVNLREYEITGQSLLTRDARGNWKFAHKSILEFFIANEALRNGEFRDKVDFAGMDIAKQFYDEIHPGADFVFVPGGKYLMGSPEGEADRRENEIQHEVFVDDFYIMKYPVTVEQYQIFKEETGYKKGDKPAIDPRKAKHPVIDVSWDDASTYCIWLSKKKKTLFRLPTEAEWEYACRAGSQSSYCFGSNADELIEFAWYSLNSNKSTQPVGLKKPNKFGIYDMHGNVWEWCLDWYGEYAKNFVQNPTGPETGSDRVLRGGSWAFDRRFCRCAFRLDDHPGYRSGNFGFRVVSSRSQ